jgi:nitrite reductase/ring-hydroxylating ferredoxin subunit
MTSRAQLPSVGSSEKSTPPNSCSRSCSRPSPNLTDVLSSSRLPPDFPHCIISSKVYEAYPVAILLLGLTMLKTLRSSFRPQPPRRSSSWRWMAVMMGASIGAINPASGFVLHGVRSGVGGAQRTQLLPSSKRGKSPLRTASSTTSTSSLTSAASVATDAASAPSQRFQQEGPGRWDSFDYLRHWYPVAWQIDLPVGSPTKQTLFDQDYAVVVTPNDEVLAFVDRCPHRSAALSEGRLVSNAKYLQCAYHGWSFDANGTCVDIPQSSGSPSTYSPRACAKAVPALVHQGMLWLWPGPDPPHKMPPTVPELDDPAFKVLRLVRDFPIIDWSILLSNIMDPVRNSNCYEMLLGTCRSRSHRLLCLDCQTAGSRHVRASAVELRLVLGEQAAPDEGCGGV